MSGLEKKLAEISTILTSDELILYLNDKNNLVISRAVNQAAAINAEELRSEIAKILFALLTAADNIKTDKGCRAKIACVKALSSFKSVYEYYDLICLSLTYRQLEPVFGGKEDTGAFLRAEAVTALAQITAKDTVLEISPLIFDTCYQPQIAAVKALKYIASNSAISVLRAKAAAGSQDTNVLAELFSAIIEIDPDPLMFFKRLLYSDYSDVGKINILFAAGNFKTDEAFEFLKEFYDINSDLMLKRQIIIAISFTRTEKAYQFLKNLLKDGGTNSISAAESIVSYLTNDHRINEVKSIVKETGDDKLADIISSNLMP